MDDLFIYILIAAVTCLVGWGGYMLVQGFSDGGERKRLADRLASDRVDGGVGPVGTGGRPSIVLQQMDASGLPPRLAAMPFFQALNRHLNQAFPEVALARFLMLAVGLCAVLSLMAWAVTGNVILGLGGAVVGGYGPFFIVAGRRAKRQKLLAAQIPDALDFLSRVLRAGHSLTTGLQMMGEELPKPMSEEFGKCYDQHSLGQPLEECLKGMSGRIESTDFAFFITAVLIQRQSGGDLSEVLRNISGMIRQRIRLQQHVKAKTAEGRFTGYILVAFPAVMFLIAYVLNPGYAGILVNTSTGRMLLLVAFSLCCLGLFAIRKITTVKV